MCRRLWKVGGVESLELSQGGLELFHLPVGYVHERIIA